VLSAPATEEAALLLGWRNVLPVEDVTWEGARADVTIAGGQRVLAEAGHLATGVPGSGLGFAVALHADRLELRGDDPVGHSGELSGGVPTATKHDGGGRDAGRIVRGTVVGVEDAGAFYVVHVALIPGAAGGGPETELVATCSPREWTTLGADVGSYIAVRVPDGAARLVQRDSMGTRSNRGESGDGDG
jgi:hypothetical protein